MSLQQTPTGQNILVKFDIQDGVLIASIDNPPVNAGSWGVRQGLSDAMAMASTDETIKAVVIIGAGKTFISGSDIREFGKPLHEPLVPQLIKAIEACPKPVVAAIHGAGLGGGYEIALACDYRIAAATAVVGLPEVRLGIIPGAGGTQRLPRLTGMSRAIELISSARRVNAPEAVRLGMIDEVTAEDLRSAAIAAAKTLAGRKRLVRAMPIPSEPAEAIAKAENAASKSAKGLDSVDIALDILRRTISMDFDAALALEREAFETLRLGEQATALRYQFFAERQAQQLPGLDKAVPRAVEKVGILGAGTMGSGIAIAFLDAGYSVTLIDRTDEALAAGLARIQDNYAKSVASKRISDEAAVARLAHLGTTTDIQVLADCDLLLEAVFEDYDVKLPVMRQLGALARPGAIIASNTSYLDLDRLAEASNRAEDVVGLHFFSPAHIMKLLEVVRGARTAPDVLTTALAIGKRLKKTAVIAGVGEGFIGNRIYAAYRRHCEFMVEDGASPQQIDQALQSFGLAMGPFAVSDLSGLDIAWKMRQRLSATRDPRERYVAIADRLCEAGRLGRKTGAGWYSYDKAEGRGQPDPKAAHIIDECRRQSGRPQRSFSDVEIVRRALAAMVNEAVLLLSEGIAQRPSDVDLAIVNGYGFPAHRGGPLFWAARQPALMVEQAVDELEQAAGFGFRRAEISVLLATLSI
ncbi:3-hydroxyacyl-CoA dehydrogenase NAD-binding domain-containing protein [Rhizobium sp. FY34]|uniref:3-hydroxyacyl-CoA dehydrogenase NAD-binding domain-containing protein n=1 Tax=Rhizobium sp. FY34 TaxID=2562309 RepID=UPI0010C11D6D|nr:3-hydroxyacyl-CoA dehydrogenase NAD-binding domain-containing protein [Rhizobium sp. FY34]